MSSAHWTMSEHQDLYILYITSPLPTLLTALKSQYFTPQPVTIQYIQSHDVVAEI